MQPSRSSRSFVISRIFSFSRSRQVAESRAQSSALGVRDAGRESSASRISSSEMPTCWEIRTKATRRSSVRA